MNQSLARNLTAEEAGTYLDFAIGPISEDVAAEMMNTQIGNAAELEDRLNLVEQESSMWEKNAGELEDDNADFRRVIINADKTIREQADRIINLNEANEQLTADLDNASSNVKDQAKRLLALHEQLAAANGRADTAEQIADKAITDLAQSQHEVRCLYVALRGATACAACLNQALQTRLLNLPPNLEPTAAETLAVADWQRAATKIAQITALFSLGRSLRAKGLSAAEIEAALLAVIAPGKTGEAA